MFGVAVRASGSVAASGGKGLAVNTFDHVRRLLFVALAAGFGEVCIMEGRCGQGRCQNSVGAVTVDALRRRVLAAADVPNAGVAVDAHSVRKRLFRMAAGAIHRLGRQVIVRMFDSQIDVATGAGGLLVRRTGNDRGVHEQRPDHASGIGGRQRLIAVTLQTIAVFDFGGGQAGCPQKPRGQG